MKVSPTLTRRLSATNRGKSLEAAVVASQRNLIRVDKMPQAARRIAGGKLIPVAGPCDFYGTVCGTGQAIYFDAKQFARKLIFNVGDPAIVKPHQIAHIIRHGEAGALAGLLVESTAHGRYLWLDWRHVAAIREPSIRWDDPRWVDLGVSTSVIRFERLVAPAPAEVSR